MINTRADLKQEAADSRRHYLGSAERLQRVLKFIFRFWPVVWTLD
jgi:hypothetical protein